MKKFYEISRYILMFFAASLSGWLYEICCTMILYGKYMDRGVLHLPFCPIYGFSLILLYFIFRKIKNPAGIFFGSMLITTAVEYLVYVILENRYNIILWSYEDWPLNYKGRISLISSCIFGLMALFLLKAVVPVTDKIYNSKGKKAAALLVSVFFVFCVIWELRFHI